MPASDTDVVVIGGGIAGAAVAYFLAPHTGVVVLEREFQPGYHATGRSAAMYTEIYGNSLVRSLAAYSRPFLSAPPPGFASRELMNPRGLLYIGDDSQQDRLTAAFEEARPRVAELLRLAPGETAELVPVLRPHLLDGAVYEPGAMDIDVAALHGGYLKGVAEHGGAVFCESEVGSVARQGNRWRVETSNGAYEGRVLVDAAGAWADDVARLAGLPPLGLQPLRRTVIRFRVPSDLEVSRIPLCCDVDERFYFKPDAGLVLASLADETPSPPCDARPEELDIAMTVDRIEAATELSIARLDRTWAGLRTFAPDRTPVMGFADGDARFLWLAGQGGYGIKTSPALGELGAAMILEGELSEGAAAAGITASALSPTRFKEGAATGSIGSD